ncbi:MAG: hypothetical protein JO079_14800 [Frankiaceae bacterium]|nr:hypothetical protein [Frankiaceae bacterium]MBV9369164.1 hypothetical protein [Frankiales bacterium]
MKLMPQHRADEFARLLETGARTDDPVTAPLLTVANALTEVPAVPGPRPEFRAALRQRLVAVAAVQAASPATERPIERVRAASSSWKVQRRLVAVGAGAAVVTAVAGVGVGASRSLPGQPFYGVKRATEDIQLATTSGTEDRGKRHLQFARERLSEATALAGHTSAIGQMAGHRDYAGAAVVDTATSNLIANTLRDMDVETRSGANDLFVAYRDSGSTEPLTALSDFTVRQYRELRSLVGALPESVRSQAMSSLSLLNLVATDTVALANGSPAEQPAPGPVSSSHPSVTPRVTPSNTPSTTPSGSSGPSTAPSPGSSKPGVPHVLPSAPVIPSIPASPTLPVGPLPTAVPSVNLTAPLGH